MKVLHRLLETQHVLNKINDLRARICEIKSAVSYSDCLTSAYDSDTHTEQRFYRRLFTSHTASAGDFFALLDITPISKTNIQSVFLNEHNFAKRKSHVDQDKKVMQVFRAFYVYNWLKSKAVERIDQLATGNDCCRIMKFLARIDAILF